MRAFRMTDCASSLLGRSPAWQRPGGALPASVPPRSPRDAGKAGVWRGATPVSGFVAFCLGQVPINAGPGDLQDRRQRRQGSSDVKGGGKVDHLDGLTA